MAILCGIGAAIGACGPAGAGCVCKSPCVSTVLTTSYCASVATLCPQLCEAIELCEECKKIDL